MGHTSIFHLKDEVGLSFTYYKQRWLGALESGTRRCLLIFGPLASKEIPGYVLLLLLDEIKSWN